VHVLFLPSLHFNEPAHNLLSHFPTFSFSTTHQTQQVLVTPSILFFERLHGAAPLGPERSFCLALVSLGVAIVTVGDMAVNARGLGVATLNILVAGYYKVCTDLTAHLHLDHLKFRNDTILVVRALRYTVQTSVFAVLCSALSEILVVQE